MIASILSIIVTLSFIGCIIALIYSFWKYRAKNHAFNVILGVWFGLSFALDFFVQGHWIKGLAMIAITIAGYFLEKRKKSN